MSARADALNQYNMLKAKSDAIGVNTNSIPYGDNFGRSDSFPVLGLTASKGYCLLLHI